MNFAMPQIPPGLLHTMYEHKTGGTMDQNAGGQWKPKKPERIPFQGAVLPISDKDLRRFPTGTFTANSQKVYTNGHTLMTGAQVEDPETKDTYTITNELGHNSIHPMKRYIVESKGGAAPK